VIVSHREAVTIVRQGFPQEREAGAFVNGGRNQDSGAAVLCQHYAGRLMAKDLGGDNIPGEGLKYRRRGGAVAQCLAKYPFPLGAELLHFKGGATDSEAQAGTHLWLEQTQQRAVAMPDRAERSMVGGGFASGRSNFLRSDPMH